MSTWKILIPLIVLVLAGYTTLPPSGPSVMALPGSGKRFERFRLDDLDCRQYAQTLMKGQTPSATGTDSGVKSAVVGTVVGAAAGAAIDGKHGAGVGAGTGLVVGSVAGLEASRVSAFSAQERYDTAYIQCMYAKGHRVPVKGTFATKPAGTLPPPPPR